MPLRWLLALTALAPTAGLLRAAGEPDWAAHPENVWVKQSPAPDRPVTPRSSTSSGSPR